MIWSTNHSKISTKIVSIANIALNDYKITKPSYLTFRPIFNPWNFNDLYLKLANATCSGFCGSRSHIMYCHPDNMKSNKQRIGRLMSAISVTFNGGCTIWMNVYELILEESMPVLSCNHPWCETCLYGHCWQ